MAIGAGTIDLWDADTEQHEKRLPGHASVSLEHRVLKPGRQHTRQCGRENNPSVGYSHRDSARGSMPDRSYGGSGLRLLAIGIGIGGLGFGDTSGGAYRH